MTDSMPERGCAEPAARPETDSFQHRVSEWMGGCFLPSLYSNMTERGDRLLEEVLELLQSKNYDRRRIATLVDYVWSRPVGEPVQEVGGVMVTLAGFCWIAGLDMHVAGESELARINLPEVMDKIRRKQEAKNALHFDTPIPGDADAQPRAVPEAIVELDECRKRGWNDSAPAYRSGWNDCRDAYFAAQREAVTINQLALATGHLPKGSQV
jgi:hypothetical protein